MTHDLEAPDFVSVRTFYRVLALRIASWFNELPSVVGPFETQQAGYDLLRIPGRTRQDDFPYFLRIHLLVSNKNSVVLERVSEIDPLLFREGFDEFSVPRIKLYHGSGAFIFQLSYVLSVGEFCPAVKYLVRQNLIGKDRMAVCLRVLLTEDGMMEKFPDCINVFQKMAESILSQIELRLRTSLERQLDFKSSCLIWNNGVNVLDTIHFFKAPPVRDEDIDFFMGVPGSSQDYGAWVSTKNQEEGDD